MKTVLIITICACFICFVSGCNSKHTPDVSDIKVNPIIERMDLALMEADTIHINSTIHSLNLRFPYFFDFYLSELSLIGHANDTNPLILNRFKQFLTYKYTRELFDSIKFKLKPEHINILKKDFTTACQYYKYYFPKAHVPKIIIYADGFSYGAVSINDSVVGLAAEMYLGEDFSLYKRLPEPLPRYETRLCKPIYMARNAMYDIISGNFSYIEDGKTLLDIMLRNGKLIYATQLMMPYTADSITTSFSKKQLDFCNKNESAFWKYFIKENLLFSRNTKDLSKYIQPGPECITPNCQPYNIGSWIGLRIIETYMDKHPGISLATLMKMDNAQFILQQSEYKP